MSGGCLGDALSSALRFHCTVVLMQLLLLVVLHRCDISVDKIPLASVGKRQCVPECMAAVFGLLSC
jgi:hypothetical protein